MNHFIETGMVLPHHQGDGNGTQVPTNNGGGNSGGNAGGDNGGGNNGGEDGDMF